MKRSKFLATCPRRFHRCRRDSRCPAGADVGILRDRREAAQQESAGGCRARRACRSCRQAERGENPSKFGKQKDTQLPEGVPTFRSDVNTVTVDVAVLDNKGHFIPKIPKGNFRVLEDGVPHR